MVKAVCQSLQETEMEVGELEEQMRTNVIEKTENAQCQKFACTRDHAMAVCLSDVVDRSDFFNSEWEIVYASDPQVVDTVELMQTAPLEVMVCIDDELVLEKSAGPEMKGAVNKMLVQELKKNIRNLSLFTAEPLVSMLPYQTIQQFRRLIAEFKITLQHLETV